MAQEQKTVAAARVIADPLAAEKGVRVWDIRYLREGAHWILRVLLDKPGGITMTDLEEFHRAFSVLLDEADPIPGAYWLEVSSPGLERDLTRDWHFDEYMGKKIQVNFIRPVENEKLYIGTLTAKEGDEFVVLLSDKEEDPALEMRFFKKETAWIRAYIDFSQEVVLEKTEEESEK